SAFRAAALAWVAATSVAAGTGRPTSLAEAQAAIEANLRTREGKAYDEKLGAEFLEQPRRTLQQCRESDRGKPESFWMLLKLDASGSVEELLLHPTTAVGECARPALLASKFSPPPRGGYWVGVYLKFQ